MSLVITIIAVTIVIAGAVFNELRTNQVSQQQETKVQQTVEEKPGTTETEAPTATPSPLPSQQPTKPQAKPTPKDEALLSNFQYPNATKESSNENSLVLKSNDDSDDITDWYKEIIVRLGMNTKSFVKTKTNDNVLNKLVGADGKTEIRVEITKPAGNPTTEIKVSITST